jgi:hypothetical protein
MSDKNNRLDNYFTVTILLIIILVIAINVIVNLL